MNAMFDVLWYACACIYLLLDDASACVHPALYRRAMDRRIHRLADT